MRLEALAPLPEGPYLREVQVLAHGQWRVVASEKLTVVVPEWAEAEPVLSLVALIAVLLALLGLTSFASTRLVRHQLDPYDEAATRVRDIHLVRADGLGAPIVRLAFFTWRGAEVDGDVGISKAYLSLAGLVAGPLVARFLWPAPQAEAAADFQPPSTLTRLMRHTWAVARGARTLVIGRRLRHAVFEGADGREIEVQLVRRIDRDVA